MGTVGEGSKSSELQEIPLSLLAQLGPGRRVTARGWTGQWQSQHIHSPKYIIM